MLNNKDSLTQTDTWLSRNITLHEYDDIKAEKENALTHAVGAIAALGALLAILFKPIAPPALKVGMLIYGISMLLLYTASSLYHWLPRTDAKRVFRILDHANIYILIAGTYSPILLYVATPQSYLLLGIIWAMVVLGIAFTLFFWGRLKPLHVIIYLIMGWLIVFFWKDIIPFLPQGLVPWVFSAGITYTAGIIFYSQKRIPHYHAIWHLFCVAASALFFIGFWKYLV